jgi:ribosomal protein S1
MTDNPLRVADELARLFRAYTSTERASDWEEVKRRFAIGSNVTGKVVAKFPFGVFVDIGVGFPALLEVIKLKDAGTRRYSIGDYPPVGSHLEARIFAWNDQGRQIGLTQLEDLLPTATQGAPTTDSATSPRRAPPPPSNS